MISYRRNILIAAFMAAALNNASVDAFAPCYSPRALNIRPLFSSAVDPESTSGSSQSVVEPNATTAEIDNEEAQKLIMDIPPVPKKKPAPKKTGKQSKEGVFSPIVLVAGKVLGQEQLNKIRAKSISLHGDLIKSFVDTSDSAFGQAVLSFAYKAIDTDRNGTLDRDEVKRALELLGFKWLKDNQMDKIFERADDDGNGEISLEEFVEEAPKTLRKNLVKLAKTNGGDMGLLV